MDECTLRPLVHAEKVRNVVVYKNRTMAEVTVVVYLPYIASFGDMALPSQTIKYRSVMLLQVKQLILRKRAKRTNRGCNLSSEYNVCMELVCFHGSLVLCNEGFQFTSGGGFFMSGWS